jgi:formyltetrahydrofolate-dependent phosphoribosylglycinamide formyltransferase
MKAEDSTNNGRVRIAVLVSGHGRGSNLSAIHEACESGEICGDLVLVVGTRQNAPAILKAQQAGICTVVVSPRKYDGDESGYESALLRALATQRPQLICLAGYMRMLPTAVLAEYRGRVMNIHAALLPLFGGRGMYGDNVHRAVIESGMKVSGCTVHFVDENYDSGPIIIQSAVPVLDSDTPGTLAARVLVVEHKSYVRAVKLFADGRLVCSPNVRRVMGADPDSIE